MRAAAAAVATVGAVCGVMACGLSAEWEKYCSFPGRCTSVDGGVARLASSVVEQVAQGAGQLDITVHGGFLHFQDAGTISVDPPVLQVSGQSWSENQVTFALEVPHGAPEGPVTVRLTFDPGAGEPEIREVSGFLTITPIVVVKGATGNAGTYQSPLCCWPAAAMRARGGDTILLRAGTYENEPWPGTAPGSAESSTLLPAGVNLRGDGPGATVLRSTHAATRAALNLKTSSHQVSELTISGFYRLINVSGAAGLSLRNVDLQGGGEKGLWVGGQATVSLDSVTVRDTAFGPDLEVSEDSTVSASSSTFADAGAGLGAVVVSGDGGLTLRGSRIVSNRMPGLYLEGYARVNGGTTAERGGNTFDNRPNVELRDARPADRGLGAQFSQTTVRGLTPDAGVYDAGLPALGIEIANPGNSVQFHE